MTPDTPHQIFVEREIRNFFAPLFDGKKVKTETSKADAFRLIKEFGAESKIGLLNKGDYYDALVGKIVAQTGTTEELAKNYLKAIGLNRPASKEVKTGGKTRTEKPAQRPAIFKPSNATILPTSGKRLMRRDPYKEVLRTARGAWRDGLISLQAYRRFKRALTNNQLPQVARAIEGIRARMEGGGTRRATEGEFWNLMSLAGVRPGEAKTSYTGQGGDPRPYSFTLASSNVVALPSIQQATITDKAGNEVQVGDGNALNAERQEAVKEYEHKIAAMSAAFDEWISKYAETADEQTDEEAQKISARGDEIAEDESRESEAIVLITMSVLPVKQRRAYEFRHFKGGWENGEFRNAPDDEEDSWKKLAGEDWLQLLNGIAKEQAWKFDDDESVSFYDFISEKPSVVSEEFAAKYAEEKSAGNPSPIYGAAAIDDTLNVIVNRLRPGVIDVFAPSDEVAKSIENAEFREQFSYVDMYPHQIKAVERLAESFKNPAVGTENPNLRGAMLVSSPGTGKTRVLFALAHHMLRNDKTAERILIVSNSHNVINTAFKGEVNPTGDWQGLSALVKDFPEVDWKRDAPIHPGQVKVATYDDISGNKIDNIEQYDTIFFDEFQYIKNVESKRAQNAAKLLTALPNRPRNILFASATPADKFVHITSFLPVMQGKDYYDGTKPSRAFLSNEAIETMKELGVSVLNSRLNEETGKNIRNDSRRLTMMPKGRSRKNQNSRFGVGETGSLCVGA